MTYGIQTYSGNNLPSKEAGEDIGRLLKNNYPESYSEKSKVNTLSKRDTSEKVKDNSF